VEKKSFDINLPVPAIVGAITGTAVANKTMKNQLLKQQQERDNTIVLNGDYYSQVNNMAENMKISFTPFSVVYFLKNGPTWVEFESIPTESMNRDMYVAWQQRDAMYFKQLLLNKIQAEIQFAEQQYARNIINKHLELGKQAGYDILPCELYGYAERLQDAYSSPNMYKVAEVLCEAYKDDVVKIAVELGGPMEKFSGVVGGALNFLGIRKHDDLTAMQNKFLSPLYLKTHGKVAFLPDRVLFVVDNVVITTLVEFDMSPEAFDHFINHDETYFKELFDRETQMGLKRMAAKLPEEKKNLNKEASLFNIPVTDIFVNNFIHPMIYYLVLTKRFTDRWLDFDTHALIKILETEYELPGPICDIALNKIMAVQSVNVAEPPYSVPLAFEKMVRSFNGLPINWMEDENEDITPEQLAFGLECFDVVTPDDDTYDEFSEDVFSYLVENLAAKNMKIFLPDFNMKRSEINTEFYEVLNEFLLNKNEALATINTQDLKQRADLIQREDLLQKALFMTLGLIKTNLIDVTDEEIRKTLAENKCPEDCIDLAIEQIREQISMDMILVRENNILEAQTKIYDLPV
jgi:hypothetical protein